MKKEYISYGLIGIIGGLIIGFLVGNARYHSGAATQPVAQNQTAQSVNSGSSQQLPPNHPNIEPGKTVPAPPLPPGTADRPVGDASPEAASGASEASASATASVALRRSTRSRPAIKKSAPSKNIKTFRCSRGCPPNG